MIGSLVRSLPPLLGPICALAVVCVPLTAGAIQQPGHLRGRGELELADPQASSVTPPKAARSGAWVTVRTLASAPGPQQSAFARLTAELGADVQAWHDPSTGRVETLIPNGSPVPGASRDGALAERFAADFLARHVELLAPGSTAADFALVSDVEANGVRSVGFVQHHAGLPVVGGQLSFRFKHDRLTAVRSQALPRVRLVGGPSAASDRADASAVAARAERWIAADFADADLDAVALASAVSAPMILPIERGASVEHREVVAVEVALTRAPGRWQVYLDARTGEPVARRSLLRWAELEYTVWQQSPLGPRVPLPAAYVEVTIDGAPATSDALGIVDLPPSGATVGFGTDGLYVRVYDDSGPVSSVATPLSPGQLFTWDLGDAPEQDAQLNGYVHAQIVKDYVRGVDPEFPPLDLETRVTVNIDDICNAYADGNTINFFLSGGGCQNTALIADVVYHEYGHVAHTQGLIPGVGLFDGAHSEGASDYLSATMLDEASVGRGFFLDSDAPIRELDPVGFEWRWPDDIGPVHDEGRIIGGALWDLRTALIEKYGYAAGVAETDRIWLDGLRRAVDIPSTYLEALITNDDDGNLQNGTPDICAINAAFAAHGLYEPPGTATAVTTAPQPDGSLEVTLTHGQPFAGCPGVVAPSGVVRYRPRAELGEPPQPAIELAMTELAPGTLQAVIPPQPELTVTQFQAELDWGNGTIATRPDNFGDPWYERFNGEATEIWCADFEDPGATAGWSLTGQWDWAAPEGGGGDPNGAFDGSFVAGIELGWPGLYFPNTSSAMTLPPLDVAGFEVVRLQYQRWLNVEDGFWDQARILANGAVAWQNYASSEEWAADTHHRDREWRFHDVVVSDFVGPDGLLTLGFDLTSDGGLEFGGWTVDRLCVVGHGSAPAGEQCGDGVVGEFEQCDDGNLQNGDGCSSGCLFEDDEDPVEPEEPTDDQAWEPDGRGCGCVSAAEAADPRGAGVGLALLGLFGALGRHRRRRRAAVKPRPASTPA